jgi:hypothetical protein
MAASVILGLGCLRQRRRTNKISKSTLSSQETTADLQGAITNTKFDVANVLSETSARRASSLEKRSERDR